MCFHDLKFRTFHVSSEPVIVDNSSKQRPAIYLVFIDANRREDSVMFITAIFCFVVFARSLRHDLASAVAVSRS